MKAVAIDLDGTLLRTGATFDSDRFERVLDACLAQGVHVVIASGRQYLSMKKMFARPDLLAFVSDNGAVVVDVDAEQVRVATVEPEVLAHAVALVDEHAELRAVASGPDGAWLRKDSPKIMIEAMHSAYENVVMVDSLTQIDGPVVKLHLITHEGQSWRLAEQLSASLDEHLVPVTTGHQGIDLIVPGRHKRWGLQALLERWRVDWDDVVAFGDSGNDVEMLAAAGVSYAMAKAEESAVAVATHRAGSNEESGVLDVLEDLLGLS